jgi:drug/metabolite transporter (DMT)-like permease
MIHRVGWGIGCALAAASLYGMVPNFARGAFLNGIPPIESILFRTFSIAVLFAIVAVIHGEKFAVTRLTLPSFIGQSVATLCVSVGYLGSVQFIPVGLAVIIFYFFPVVIMLAAPIVEGRNPGLTRIVIALVAFSGLAMAIGPGLDRLDPRGIALAGVAAGGAALQSFSGRAISRYLRPSVFGSLAHLVILPPILAIALQVNGGTLKMLPGGTGTPVSYAFLAGLGVVYVIAYMAQMMSLRFAPASAVAPYFNLEPIVTIAIATVVLGERLNFNQYAGGALVIAALVASTATGNWKK